MLQIHRWDSRGYEDTLPETMHIVSCCILSASRGIEMFHSFNLTLSLHEIREYAGCALSLVFVVSL